MKLIDLTTGLTNGKSGQAMPVAGTAIVNMGAGDESIDAFQPVNRTCFHQLVECAIYLQGRPEPMVAQFVENGIGPQRRFRRGEGCQNHSLIFRQSAQWECPS